METYVIHSIILSLLLGGQFWIILKISKIEKRMDNLDLVEINFGKLNEEDMEKLRVELEDQL